MIKTADCKQAIVDYLKKNPGHVAKQFGPSDDGKTDTEFEAPALDAANWMHMPEDDDISKGERGFDCEPYDDQLRAYTKDDGTKIVAVVVQGE